MKILRIKLTPRPDSPMPEVTWYSCPDTRGDPQKTLAVIQREADRQELKVDYSIASEQEYWACRGARAFELTEPGDKAASYVFATALVKAGLILDPAQVVSIGILGNVEGQRWVRVMTQGGQIMVNTTTGAIDVVQLPSFLVP